MDGRRMGFLSRLGVGFSTLKVVFWQSLRLRLAVWALARDTAMMMLSNESLVRSLEHHLGALECIMLFGSRADGSADADSDIDLACAAALPLARDRLTDARQALMAETGLGVDLIDLRDLSLSPILLREAVTKGAVLKDSTGAAVFERLTVILREYEDFRRRRAIVEDGLVAALANHATA
jgi:predicted nucleotidyltransferase